MKRFSTCLISLFPKRINKSLIIILLVGMICLISSCAVMFDYPGGERHGFRNERHDRHDRGDHNDHHDNGEHRN